MRVLLYEPVGTPRNSEINASWDGASHALDSTRALFVKLMDTYAALEYSRTLLEVQKLCVLPPGEAGEPLRLKYEAGHYGPYAANLNKVLEVMEGHFIRGYGDSQKPNAEIELLPGAVEEATSFLTGKSRLAGPSRPGRAANRRLRDPLRDGASGHHPLGGSSRRSKQRCARIQCRPGR